MINYVFYPPYEILSSTDAKFGVQAPSPLDAARTAVHSFDVTLSDQELAEFIKVQPIGYLGWLVTFRGASLYKVFQEDAPR